MASARGAQTLLRARQRKLDHLQVGTSWADVDPFSSSSDEDVGPTVTSFSVPSELHEHVGRVGGDPWPYEATESSPHDVMLSVNDVCFDHHQQQHTALLSPTDPAYSPLHHGGGDGGGEGVHGKKTTVAQTVYHVVNIFVGLGLLSKPYVLAQAGFLGLIALAGTCVLMGYTAMLMVGSFQRDNTESVTDLARRLGGPRVAVVVEVIVVLELFGAIAMMCIVAWSSILHVFPNHVDVSHYSFMWWIVCGATAVSVLPTVWIRSFSDLSIISLLGFGCSVTVCTVVSYVFFYAPSEALSHNTYTVVDWGGVPVACGIVLVSFSGHSCLPSLRDEMLEPHRFKLVVIISFSIMLALYCIIGVLGYLAYGTETQVLITTNLDATAQSKVARVVDKAVSVFVALSSVSSIAPVVSVVARLALDHLPASCQQRRHRLISRTLVALLAFALAMVAYSDLGLFESLLGGVLAVSTSMVIPTVFYVWTHGESMSQCSKAMHVALIGFGVLSALAIGVLDVRQLIEAHHSHTTNATSAGINIVPNTR